MNTTITLFDWASVKMEATLAVFAVLVLLGSAALPERFSKFVSILAFLGMYAALSVGFAFRGSAENALISNNYVYACLITICALLTSQMGFSYFEKIGRPSLRNEFAATVMMCAAMLILFGRSNNLMLSFVALEGATICLYIMAAFDKNSSAAVEASVKYIVIGGVSGAILLMGIAFVYGAGRLAGADYLSFCNFSAGLLNGFFKVGMIFILAGVLFKMAAFPFQFWAPDVYQGAPTPASAFFAVASKIAGVVFLAKICASLKFDSAEIILAKEHFVFAISVVAILTIIIGNFGGITQVKTKRLLAFSGISNAGYLLVLIAAILREPRTLDSFEPVLYFYLGAYMLANYALFFAVGQFDTAEDFGQSFADYRGLMKKHPITGSALAVSLASLAGIPPTAGFFGKVLVLILAWYAQLYILMGVMIVGSVVSIYYYFGWIRAMVEPRDSGECSFTPTSGTKQTIVLLSTAVVALSFAVITFVGA